MLHKNLRYYVHYVCSKKNLFFFQKFSQHFIWDRQFQNTQHFFSELNPLKWFNLKNEFTISKNSSNVRLSLTNACFLENPSNKYYVGIFRDFCTVRESSQMNHPTKWAKIHIFYDFFEEIHTRYLLY